MHKKEDCEKKCCIWLRDSNLTHVTTINNLIISCLVSTSRLNTHLMRKEKKCKKSRVNRSSTLVHICNHERRTDFQPWNHNDDCVWYVCTNRRQLFRFLAQLHFLLWNIWTSWKIYFLEIEWDKNTNSSSSATLIWINDTSTYHIFLSDNNHTLVPDWKITEQVLDAALVIDTNMAPI